MRAIFVCLAFLLSVWEGQAYAQTGCTPQTGSQLLTSFSDTGAAGRITPQTIRNFVCSSDINAVPAIVSAAGNTQGTATTLASNLNIVTSATALQGVVATANYTKVWNDTTVTIQVYPISGAQFEGYGTNIPVNLGPSAAMEVAMSSTTQGYVRITPAQGAATATFTVSGGQVYDPTGAQFRAWGANVWGCPIGSDQDAITGGTNLSKQMRTLLPGLNLVRLAFKQNCGTQAQWAATTAYASGNQVISTHGLFTETTATCTSGSTAPDGTGTGIVDGTCHWNYVSSWGNTNTPSNVAPFINDMTANKVLVVIEDHDTARRVLTNATTPSLALEHTWYSNMASYYKGNPYVAFTTMNEPGYPYTAAALTASIAGNIMTTTATTNTLYVGSIIIGTGVAANTTITAFGSGTATTTGTYYVTPAQNVGSESMTGNYGELNQMLDTYSAIRNDSGSNALIWLAAGQNMQNSLDSLLICGPTGWCNQGAPSAATLAGISKLRGVLWDDHTYGASGTTVALVLSGLNGGFGLNEWALAPGADGLIPTIALEGGNSSSGTTADTNATVEMQGNFINNDSRWSGFAAWFWNCVGCTADMNNMINSAYTQPATPTFSNYGNNVACYIARTTPIGQTTASTCPTP